MSELTSVTEQLARKASVAAATAMADLEQKQRVDRASEERDWDAAERVANQRRASKLLDAEQARRVQQVKDDEAADADERTSNQQAAVAAMVSFFLFASPCDNNSKLAVPLS